MSGTQLLGVTGWLLRAAVGGGLLLLLIWGLACLTRHPARRQRLGEWGVLAALLVAGLALAPAWLRVPLPSWTAPTENRGPRIEDRGSRTEDRPRRSGDREPGLVAQASATQNVQPEPPSAPILDPQSSVLDPRLLLSGLAAAYLAVAGFLLGRWLLQHVALASLLAATEEPPAAAAELFASLTTEEFRPRLRVSPRLRVPFSCGVWRPTVVLPAALCRSPEELRWVFAHELTHLRRGDPWACLLFGLGGVVYFFLPWFWLLRRQVRLCQEYLADAAAAAGEGRPAEYAQFLLGLTQAPAAPAGTAGVAGPTSDLFRRITMLLRTPLSGETSCPRRWSLGTAAGLLALALLLGGVGLGTSPPAVSAQPPKKDPPAKEPGKDRPRQDPNQAKPRPRLPEVPDDLDLDDLEALRDALQKSLERFADKMQNMHQRELGRFQDLRQGPVRQANGRLGVRVEKPGDTLVDQLDLPAGEGLVVVEVAADSAAAAAGLKPHDILLEFDGKPVPADAPAFVKMVQEVKGGVPVEATVLRKGRRETLKGLTLAGGKPAVRR
jgi:beta-lactamase regulating signal transducer with metallopeptidase domain